ncbi:MAG TPA: MBL fold metallo-hydrolase [Steroidobacteraceae bacterium]|jgi:glyoxylase-like metal-dependent hydrolase (beta-lactamase superfamily II)
MRGIVAASRSIAWMLLLCAGLSLAGTASAQKPGTNNSSAARRAAARAAADMKFIRKVTGTLYRVQYGAGEGYQQMVYVTPAGIILTDTNSTADAEWLRGQLAQRFPGRPVRYIIMSHYHFDHALGTQVFPQAKVVSSDETVRKLRSLNLRYAPPPGNSIDINGDNRFSRSEARNFLVPQFDQFDTNKDGFVDAAELNAGIHVPDVTFTGRMTLRLGGRRVELIERPGRSGGVGGMVDSYFPDEKVLFLNDYLPPHRVYPGWANFDHAPLDEWVAAIDQLQSLDFLMYVSSHWDDGTRQDLIDLGSFYRALQAAVRQGIAAGKSEQELLRTVKLDGYSEWADYDSNLAANVASAYNLQTLYRDCASMGIAIPASRPGPGVTHAAVCYSGLH